MRISRLILSVLSFVTADALADCTASLPLSGTISVKTCDPEARGCALSDKLFFEYIGRVRKDKTEVTAVAMASPWHLYDGDMRIIGVEELADKVRPLLVDPVARVRLIGSWTGVAPDKNRKSLAEQLSAALDGFPVSGMDGFLWISKDGRMRTTQQAFTIKDGIGPYGVPKGADILVSLVSGWPSEVQDFFIENKDADGVMRAGAGWEIFNLCPERALATYEIAAEMGDAIAAYNAAIIRLERNAEGDRQAALALLTQATARGDEKSRLRLQQLQSADGERGTQKPQ